MSEESAFSNNDLSSNRARGSVLLEFKGKSQFMSISVAPPERFRSALKSFSDNQRNRYSPYDAPRKVPWFAKNDHQQQQQQQQAPLLQHQEQSSFQAQEPSEPVPQNFHQTQYHSVPSVMEQQKHPFDIGTAPIIVGPSYLSQSSVLSSSSSSGSSFVPNASASTTGPSVPDSSILFHDVPFYGSQENSSQSLSDFSELIQPTVPQDQFVAAPTEEQTVPETPPELLVRDSAFQEVASPIDFSQVDVVGSPSESSVSSDESYFDSSEATYVSEDPVNELFSLSVVDPDTFLRDILA